METIPTPSKSNKDAISHIVAQKLSDIYYGRTEHPWAVEIEQWEKDEINKCTKKSINSDIEKIKSDICQNTLEKQLITSAS